MKKTWKRLAAPTVTWEHMRYYYRRWLDDYFAEMAELAERYR